MLQQQPHIVNIVWNCYIKERSWWKKTTIWENTDGCADQYRCATALYLLSILYNAYNNVIYRGFGTPEHGKYIVYGLNANEKIFLTILMITVQLPDASTNESQIVMHTSMSNTYISQERVF